MGWFKNVFKSLSDAGGVITQTEATEEEVNEFLESMGASTDRATIRKLENGLENREGLLKRLKPEKVKNVKQEKDEKSKTTKQPLKEEERE